METKTEIKAKPHSLTLENREKAVLSGITKVVNSSDTLISLVTGHGDIVIMGKDFKIEKFSIDDGSLTLSGSVDCIKYTAQKSPLIRRIFK